MSEVIAEKGIKVVGLIPQGVQLNTVYGAAVLSGERRARARHRIRQIPG